MVRANEILFSLVAKFDARANATKIGVIARTQERHLSTSIKAYIWIVCGVIAFYFIGFELKSHLDERYQWPVISATVVKTELAGLNASQGVSNQAVLKVWVTYQQADGNSQTARYSHSGHVKMMKELQADQYANGATLEVHINPEGDQFHPPNTSTWGMWIVATLVGLFFVLNGMTLLAQSKSTASK